MEDKGLKIEEYNMAVPQSTVSSTQSRFASSRSPVPNSEIAISVRNLSKKYQLYDSPQHRLKEALHPFRKKYHRDFWALQDVSFEVKKGETFGIIGKNGSGKSTLLKIITGVLAPTSGSVLINGRVSALLELGNGFNPEFTGIENIYFSGSIIGFEKEEIDAKLDDILAFADIGDFVYQPAKTYSSGMYVRLAFAIQAIVDPEIFVIDEALAVGDVFFRQKCYARLEQLRNSGVAILLVSHSMPDIEQYCKRAILLDHGTQRFIGPASEVTKHYYLLHQAARIKGSPQTHVPMNVPEKTSGNYAIERPPAEAFFDLSSKTQVSNGQARCTGVALCNANGEACNVFRQGDLAVFYYEFELIEDIGVPICGIVISNDRGVIVHGKNSWQYDEDVPASMGPGSKVVCRQEVGVDLGPGGYVFEIGLASVSTVAWQNREHVSHEEMSSIWIRVCHIANVGSFSVRLAERNGFPMLTHHGIANLPGKLKITTFTK